MEESESFTTEWFHRLELRDMNLGFLEPSYFYFRIIDNELAETSGAFGI